MIDPLRAQLSVTYKRLHDALGHDGDPQGCQEWQCVESRYVLARSEEPPRVNCGDTSASRRRLEPSRVVVVEV